MIENLTERNLTSLAMLMLEKDKKFTRLMPEERVESVFSAISLGEEIADWVIAEFKENDPRKIAERLDAKIIGIDTGGSKRSEYRPKQKEIIIYRDALDRFTSEIIIPELSSKILGFLVAWELFCHLEHIKTDFVYKKFKFKKRFHRGFYLKELSRVAALAFTIKLLGLEITPCIFDYMVYMIFTSEFKDYA
ncbi:hypothetical protein A3J90_08275 [candidate division WOR-1 bacterium RIFOXYC2_FULL_37_10]|uniref:Uncharacterized protein n=1 Tax=candidate division WOR-1 bacterium RIFOXYB2_FULL_37_13 TaxID=1802579 RepID=A0A1F4SQI6_UNCSA|nr:MAG: hypothetical protein A2246_04540 [candidate division WOR-1 bacterium RIFOXYA2_FULL_37_7]OGC22671.1 MAG: hypothetical protein A2310_07940 [candidate division WOR-1 bacterium RIFOXYB2_FULL_37_13]OGC37390.1 MAG: hypothetical protein A3J90_08275 [candidate division WOR-1 bacterium RIFOXYC2_FULL_37_10]